MTASTTFAERTYRWAAIYGIIALAPMYFMEDRIGRDMPPPITHPEHFYGFVGLALVWQFVFLLIARDARRFRPLMPITFLEKLAFGIPVMVLAALGRVSAPVVAVGTIDLMLCVLFYLAWRKTPVA